MSEGDPLSYSVTADAGNNGSVEQTGTGIADLNNYNASPVMGPWTNSDYLVRFRGYANDPLHTAAAGTQITSVPANLIAMVFPAAPTGWAYTGIANPTGSDFGQGVAVDNAGRLHHGHLQHRGRLRRGRPDVGFQRRHVRGETRTRRVLPLG
ncbi:MAG TPA: hypothetical protein VEI97_14165 [bacterium]|nr:hypothetical protein [bacterium]